MSASQEPDSDPEPGTPGYQPRPKDEEDDEAGDDDEVSASQEPDSDPEPGTPRYQPRPKDEDDDDEVSASARPGRVQRCKQLRIVAIGTWVGDRSRAVSRHPPVPLYTIVAPYRGLRVRRWGLGIVHRSRAISVAPCQTLAYDSQLLHRCSAWPTATAAGAGAQFAADSDLVGCESGS